MPIISPQKKRLRLAAFLAVIALIGLGVGFFILTQNLTRLAQWGIKKSLPAAKIDVQDVQLSGPGEITFTNFVIHDPQTGQELVRLEKGTVVFSFDDLAKRQLGEVRLVNPVIVVSPGWSGMVPEMPADTQSANPLGIRRIVCDYGEIRYDGATSGNPDVCANFSIDWQNFSPASTTPLELTLWDIRATASGFPDPFLVLDIVRLVGSPATIINKWQLDSIDITGGTLAIGSALDQIAHTRQPAPAGPANTWRIDRMNIKNLRSTLGDNAWKTGLSFVLNTNLQNLTPAEITNSIGGATQTLELTDITIPSPLDPFTKVLTLRSVFIRFTLARILHHEIDEVTVLHPKIFIEEDLFAYMDDARSHMKSDSSTGWKIGKLDVKFGSLVIGSGGRSQYGLPLNFQTTAENVSLNDLASLKLSGSLEIPAQEYKFPAYQIEATTSPGEIRFSYPPDKRVSNVVGTVKVKNLRWRQFQSRDSWISVTFDRGGINGEFGGGIYGGQTLGGFSFLFDNNSPWIAWLGGANIDLKKLTDILAPQNFVMTGPLGFKMQLNAVGRHIDRVKGQFQTTSPGRLRIGKIDDLLDRIPTTWSNLKKSGLRIALENARDFDYTTCVGDFWIVQNQGVLDLKLQGPLGSRTFETFLHADDSPDGLWKKSTKR